MMKQLGKQNNRKMYNTATADYMAYRKGGTGDSTYYEILYKTNRGDFFINGRGGKLTRWNGVENIIEISGDALKHWLTQAKGGTK
jgi:hypothetical protein